ncbi:MAG: hypothetical protein JXB19_10395 [Bacteroidales bacterium]|nr:hypothetical protein [Bacteroidales bacterium]
MKKKLQKNLKYISSLLNKWRIESNAFSATGNLREDILSITAVHPINEDSVLELLHNRNDSSSLLTALVEDKLIEKPDYGVHIYYLRKFKKQI